MKEEPLVSVVINCYNGEKYLKEAIDSVYEQTYQNWEIIFWDNASTDRTAEIAKSYDEKLKYFRSKKTTILGKARVEATQVAKGDYLAFLDADDIWLKNKLSEQMAFFEDNVKCDLALVYGRSIIFDNEKSVVFKEGCDLPVGKVFPLLTKENFIPFLSVIVDKEKFFECGGFPVNYMHSTDYSIFLSMSYKFRVQALQHVCCKNRMHENNLSHRTSLIGIEESILTLSSFLPDKHAKIGIEYNSAHMLKQSFLKKNFREGIIYLFKKDTIMGVMKIFFEKIFTK